MSDLLKDQLLEQRTYELLEERGIPIKEIALIVQELQEPYIDNLSLEHCIENVHAVLRKREVQNAVITGLEIDIAAEHNHFSPLLCDLLMRDEGLYGIDEILVLSIVNIYGSIGLTNFGYVDKTKPGIIGRLNSDKDAHCNTFADDIVGAIAAAAASRIAHLQIKIDDIHETLTPKAIYKKKGKRK